MGTMLCSPRKSGNEEFEEPPVLVGEVHERRDEEGPPPPLERPESQRSIRTTRSTRSVRRVVSITSRSGRQRAGAVYALPSQRRTTNYSIYGTEGAPGGGSYPSDFDPEGSVLVTVRSTRVGLSPSLAPDLPPGENLVVINCPDHKGRSNSADLTPFDLGLTTPVSLYEAALANKRENGSAPNSVEASSLPGWAAAIHAGSLSHEEFYVASQPSPAVEIRPSLHSHGWNGFSPTPIASYSSSSSGPGVRSREMSPVSIHTHGLSPAWAASRGLSPVKERQPVFSPVGFTMSRELSPVVESAVESAGTSTSRELSPIVEIKPHSRSFNSESTGESELVIMCSETPNTDLDMFSSRDHSRDHSRSSSRSRNTEVHPGLCPGHRFSKTPTSEGSGTPRSYSTVQSRKSTEGEEHSRSSRRVADNEERSRSSRVVCSVKRSTSEGSANTATDLSSEESFALNSNSLKAESRKSSDEAFRRISRRQSSGFSYTFAFDEDASAEELAEELQKAQVAFRAESRKLSLEQRQK